ncbi:cyclic diguanylate phosphodiesterase [Leptospira kobayashii]|uniref:Cyclic diguanylate phosphodiesterase n=1 Tax=Leptospira kobayashii TaxID=1917830 RepID=A0ABN6KLV6_9LEPT|nr:GAF domain-containing protein [Leptospira kobayashii]BDA79815.1 cyclic diguanylate phosphodiesterase [Leptospira kobayashii]
MGLLDKAEKVQSAVAKSGPADKPSAKPPSLLKKAEDFLKSNETTDWIDDDLSMPASEISDDLPVPDGEEEIDLSDLPDFEQLSDGDDSDFWNDDEEHKDDTSDIGDLFGDEENTSATDEAEDDSLLEYEPELDESPEPQTSEEEEDLSMDLPEEPEPITTPEPVAEEEEPGFELPSEPEDDSKSEIAELPEVNLFDEWEKEAQTESSKHPIQPPEEDAASSDKQFLFDDESDFGTAPMAHHLASKKRIENYQAVFEITKEIASSNEFSEFFENLVYSIIGQVGCSSVVIFTSTNPEVSRWDAVEAQGLDLKENWSLFPSDDIYQRILDSETVIYAGDLKRSRLPERELTILNELDAEILVPLRNKEECYGFLSLGKLINGEEYITDDLEFVKIVGDIAGSVFTRVAQFEKLTEELTNAKQVIETNESVLQFAREFASVRKMDDAYDLLIENVKKKLGVKQFSFLVLDSETRSDYVIFGSNFILPERAKDFKLSKDSDIVGMVSNVPGVYKLENFRDDVELKSIFTNDELGVMSEFTILPIINLNWLVGMVIVHSTGKPWTDITRDVAVAMLETSAPVFANLLILSEKEALFRNPFNPLESKILSEIEKAKDLNLSFTVSLFKIQNVPRMINLFGAGKFARYADTLRKTIIDHIGENDFFTRVGQGKFAIILHGKDKEESEIVIRKIKSSFVKKDDFFDANFKPSYRILTLAYPTDTKDKNQFLEMIEEA